MIALLNNKLKTNEVSAINIVKIQIKKEYFYVEDPYILKVDIPNKDIYVVFGIIKPWAEMANILTDTQSIISNMDMKPIISEAVSLSNMDTKNAEDQVTSIENNNTNNNINNNNTNNMVKSDIDIVMEQTNATRNQAIQAINQYNGDIVEAIMSLSI